MLRVRGGGNILVERSGDQPKEGDAIRPRRPSIAGGCYCRKRKGDA